MQIHHDAGVEQPRQNLQGLELEAVTRQPHGDQGVVVGPYRTVVVGHGIETRFVYWGWSESPSRERVNIQLPLIEIIS